MDDPIDFLRTMFKVAIRAAQADVCLPSFLPQQPKGRSIVIGAGKASAAMAETAEKYWSRDIQGIVITQYGFGRPCNYIEVIEASHPIPDEAGLEATNRIMRLLNDLTEEDLVLCLISGGGSALLTLPAKGIKLSDKQTINQELLKSGAPISEINTVRKHLSRIKGGRLAAACVPAQLHTLIISDIPGDDPSLIASGPTFPNLSTSLDALEILEKYHVAIPASVLEYLNGQTKEECSASAYGTHAIIASSMSALDAAKAFAQNQGVRVTNLGDSIEGEAQEVGQLMAGRVLQEKKRPHVFVSGGETTVTVKGEGRGGPNAEFLLGLAMVLNGASNIFALSCDTDGIDGSGDNAGGFITPDTLARAKRLGFDAQTSLVDNDSYSYFEALGNLVKTGPTYTNVNDFRAILVL